MNEISFFLIIAEIHTGREGSKLFSFPADVDIFDVLLTWLCLQLEVHLNSSKRQHFYLETWHYFQPQSTSFKYT